MSTQTLRRLVKGERPSHYQEAFADAVGDFMVRLDGAQTQVVLLTSPEPRAGTTCVAFGIASGLSTHGLRVLLIDANVKHPALTELLALKDRPGFREYARTGNLPEPTKPSTTYPALAALGVGAEGSLTRAGTAGLAKFAALRKQFDFVLIDAPAICESFESQLLAEQADHVVLVVGEGRTTLTATAQAKQLLIERQAHCLGVLTTRHRSPVPAFLNWMIPA